MLAWTGLVMCDHFFSGPYSIVENIILLKFTKRYIIYAILYILLNIQFFISTRGCYSYNNTNRRYLSRYGHGPSLMISHDEIDKMN